MSNLLKFYMFLLPFESLTIKIKINLHIAVMVFMVFWLWTPGSIGTLALLAWLVDRFVGQIFLLLFGMCLFGGFLCLISFKIEVKKSKHFFQLCLIKTTMTDAIVTEL